MSKKIKKGDGGIRTRDGGFADPCLNHLATSPKLGRFAQGWGANCSSVILPCLLATSSLVLTRGMCPILEANASPLRAPQIWMDSLVLISLLHEHTEGRTAVCPDRTQSPGELLQAFQIVKW